MKFSHILFISFVLLFSSCSEDDSYEPITEVSQYFTEQELSILNEDLNLNLQLFNYANPELPWHYDGADTGDSDNTPEDNQITNFGATLGRVLFYDKNLSANNTILRFVPSTKCCV